MVVRNAWCLAVHCQRRHTPAGHWVLQWGRLLVHSSLPGAVPWRVRLHRDILVLCIHVRLTLGQRHLEGADRRPGKYVPSGVFPALPPPKELRSGCVSLGILLEALSLLCPPVCALGTRLHLQGPELASTLGNCSIKMAQ